MVIKSVKLKFSFILFIFFFQNVYCQNSLGRFKAEQAVMKYMTSKNKNYKALTFGELFEQTSSNEIQDKLKTKNQISYTIIHTYKIGKKQFVDDYFQLDKNYDVVGVLTDAETTEIAIDLLKKSGKMDSIYKSYDIKGDTYVPRYTQSPSGRINITESESKKKE
jgi:hypothetical protein